MDEEFRERKLKQEKKKEKSWRLTINRLKDYLKGEEINKALDYYEDVYHKLKDKDELIEEKDEVTLQKII